MAGLKDDQEFWLEVGVDISSRIWTNTEVLTIDELRGLGGEQIQNPIPGRNPEVLRLEALHPELGRRHG